MDEDELRATNRHALAMSTDETIERATDALMGSYSLHRDPRPRMGGGQELDRDEYSDVVKIVLSAARTET